jgi:hypothetical protein
LLPKEAKNADASPSVIEVVGTSVLDADNAKGLVLAKEENAKVENTKAQALTTHLTSSSMPRHLQASPPSYCKHHSCRLLEES